MNVSQKVVDEFFNKKQKILRIVFPDLGFTVPAEKIYGNTMMLEESIASGSFAFVGCKPSSFSIQIEDVLHNYVNQWMEVFICTKDTRDEQIPLFKGYVKEAESKSNKKYQKLLAYDLLYSFSDRDITEWYYGLTFPMTLKQFRDSLFTYLNVVQEDAELTNDNMIIPARIELAGLNCLKLIKNICQINAVFGIMNRYGHFEYRSLKAGEVEDDGMYPGLTLFPGADTFPGVGAGSGGTEEGALEDYSFSSFKKVEYKEYTVNPVDRVTILKGSNDTGISFGEGTNSYIIKGNFFTKNASDDQIQQMAENIFNSVADIEFVPFVSENMGLPFVECGMNTVSYYLKDYKSETPRKILKTFFVLGRTLTGCQALQDKYVAEGKELQKEFVTEIKAYDDAVTDSTVQQAVSNYTYTKDEFPSQVNNLINQKQWFRVVDEKPSTFEQNVIYFVRK